MPTFQNRPPTGSGTNNLQIIRTPATGVLVGLIASPDLLGTATHYWNGRTVPHETENCEPCLSKVSWRWHSYLVIQKQPEQQFFLLELTAQATDPLVEYRKLHKELRGAVIKTKRRGERRNGRVCVDIFPRHNDHIVLREPPDVLDVLCNLWGLDRARMETDQTRRERPAVFAMPGPDRVNDYASPTSLEPTTHERPRPTRQPLRDNEETQDWTSSLGHQLQELRLHDANGEAEPPLANAEPNDKNS